MADAGVNGSPVTPANPATQHVGLPSSGGKDGVFPRGQAQVLHVNGHTPFPQTSSNPGGTAAPQGMVRVSHRHSASMPAHPDATPGTGPSRGASMPGAKGTPDTGGADAAGRRKAAVTPPQANGTSFHLRSSSLAKVSIVGGAQQDTTPAAPGPFSVSGRIMDASRRLGAAVGGVSTRATAPAAGTPAVPTKLFMKSKGLKRSQSGDIYGATNTVVAVDGVAAGGAGLRGFEGEIGMVVPRPVPSAPMKAARPRMVQDTATCIPLIKLIGRFARPEGGPQPVRELRKRLRVAVGAVQGPMARGLNRLKSRVQGVGLDILDATGRQMTRAVSALADGGRPEEPAPLLLARMPESSAGQRQSADGAAALPAGMHSDERALAAVDTPPAPAADAGTPALDMRTSAQQQQPGATSPRLLTSEFAAVAGTPVPDEAVPPGKFGPAETVYVQIKGARGLVKPMVVGVQEEWAPYCIMLIGSHRRQTAVMRGSDSPLWNEVFTFTANQVAEDGFMQLEVWDRDAWGRDCFIGQADLDLCALLFVPGAWHRAHELNLGLIQRDALTGRPEPGIYGMLSIIAGIGSTMPGARSSDPNMTMTIGAARDVVQDKYHVSSLLVRAGVAKGLPLVGHSPFGTVYEEPCIMYVKVAILAFRDLNAERLLHAAITTNRTVKLTPNRSAGSGSPGSKKLSRWFTSKSAPGMVNHPADNLSPRPSRTAVTPGGGPPAKRSLMRMSTQAAKDGANPNAKSRAGQLRKRAGKPGGSAEQLPTLVEDARQGPGMRGRKGDRGFGGRQRERSSMEGDASRHQHEPQGVTGVATAIVTAPLKGAAFAGRVMMKGLRFAATGVATAGSHILAPLPIQTGQPGQGFNPREGRAMEDGGDALDEYMGDEVAEDDQAEGGDAFSEVLEETEQGGGSIMDNTTTTGDVVLQGEGGGAPGSGPGTYYYIKASMGGQTFRTRMRWMSIVDLTEVKLPRTFFCFTVSRPLQEGLVVSISVYVTPTKKRKGRVVAQMTQSLKELLNPLAPGTVTGRDGQPEGIILPFDDIDVGAARLLVQAADADWRAALYKVPKLAAELQAPCGEDGSRAGVMDCLSTVQDLNAESPLAGSNRHPSMDNAWGALAQARSRSPKRLTTPDTEADLVRLDQFVSGDPLVMAVLRSSALTRQLVTSVLAYIGGQTSHCSGAPTGGKWRPPGQVSPADCADDPEAVAAIRDVRFFRSLRKFFGTVSDRVAAMRGQHKHSNSQLSDEGLAGLRGAGTAAGPPTGAAAPVTGRPPIGEVRVRLGEVRARANASSATGEVYAVLRCGAHWVRTAAFPVGGSGAAGDALALAWPGGVPGWEIRFPLYDPSVVLSVAVVEVQNATVGALVGMGAEHVVAGKARIRVSTLDAFDPDKPWHDVRVMGGRTVVDGAGGGGAPQALTGPGGAGGAQQGARQRSGSHSGGGAVPGGGAGAASNGQGGAAAAPADTGAGSGGQVLCSLQVQVRYPGVESAVWSGGLRLLAVYSDAALPDAFYYLEVDDRDTWTVIRKQEANIVQKWLSNVEPPILPHVASAIMKDGRDTFSLGRAQQNFERLLTAFGMFTKLQAWFEHICSWSEPQKSAEVGFCILLFAYYPSTAFKLFFYLLALASWRQYIKRERALRDPSHAATTQRTSQDEEEDIPAHTTLAMLRQQYARILEIALTAQNLFDDMASFFERLQAILSWRDRVASFVFLASCLMAMVAIQLLGLSTVMFMGLMWQIRPPFMRDPIPPRPVNYFLRLPCQTDDMV